MASTSILSRLTSGIPSILSRNLVPHHHAATLRVGLGDDREEFARARLCELERIAHDSLDADASEHRNFGPKLLRHSVMDAAAATGIFAFRVFARDHPVEVDDADIAQRRGDAGQDLGRPYNIDRSPD
jgi:hypothetical protein